MKRLLIPLALFLTGNLYAQTPAQLQAQITQLKTLVAQLQSQVINLQRSPVQALAPFVAVNPNPENGVRGPNIVFHDCNLHLTNGSFNTATGNGLGNLIIGYNTLDATYLGYPVRAGSHNLVIGDQNQWRQASTCSIISGAYQEVDGPNSAAIGGSGHRLWRDNAVAIGGSGNTVNSSYATIVGGAANTSQYANFSAMLGGEEAYAASTPFIGQFGEIRNP